MVTDLKVGDEYWRTKHNITGIVLKTEPIKGEFSNYLIIHFERADNKNINQDIYRISDGAFDLFIGSVYFEKRYDINPYVALDLLDNDIYPNDRHLPNELEAINHLIANSERALKIHFENLEFSKPFEHNVRGNIYQ